MWQQLAPGLGVCVAVLAMAPAARADTLWWTAELDDDASRLRNRTWPRIASADLVTGGLYVGGWPENLVPTFGDPEGHSGVLTLEGGSLTTAERSGSPPCDYLRIGYNGAAGRLEQTGGVIRSCTYISLGFPRGTSAGRFELTGGEVDAFGIDTGVTGSGSMRQDGGQTDLQVHNVGRGYTHRDEFDPGSGSFHLRGGTHEARILRLGAEPGSVGLAAVQGGTLRVDLLEVGRRGSGALLQSGGRIEAGRVVVAQGQGGSGQLTVSGGLLEIAGELRVGGEAGGRGRTTITAGGRVEATRLVVEEASSLQFVADARGAGQIAAARTVEFREGATVDIEVASTNAQEPEPTLGPALGDRLRLVEAPAIVGAPRLADGDEAQWRIDRHAGGIDAIYYPCELRCDLDHDGRVGNEDLVLMNIARNEIECDGDGEATVYDVFALWAELGRSCPD